MNIFLATLLFIGAVLLAYEDFWVGTAILAILGLLFAAKDWRYLNG